MTDIGRYRIQSVAEMTGISAATLRAWERRYGIPAPQRTPSAYRLYSDRDVELIRQLRGLCEAGIAPAQAVQMVQVPGVREETSRFDDDVAELAVQKILAGVDRFDADMIQSAVGHALFLGSAATLFDRVFAPVIAEVGRRWRTGALSVGQERLVGEILGSALRDLVRMIRPGSPARRVVLACFAEEDHTLPLLGVALVLSEWNMQAVLLGARMSPAALRQVVAEIHPDMVGLSVTTSVPSGRAPRLVEEYADAVGRTPWLVGGQGSQELRGLVEAHGGVMDPGERVLLRATIDRMMNRLPGEAVVLPARAG